MEGVSGSIDVTGCQQIQKQAPGHRQTEAGNSPSIFLLDSYGDQLVGDRGDPAIERFFQEAISAWTP
ncbi:MAG TPA: hypothetical protein VMU68_10545 [Acidimicrobiales bacterium]|nr:hypothetical protein [Acidimicrobiales bacterium]